MSGELSHRRPLIIVDNVPPEPVSAAANDIACRATDLHELVVRTCSRFGVAADASSLTLRQEPSTISPTKGEDRKNGE
jgi:hypothetical protein